MRPITSPTIRRLALVPALGVAALSIAACGSHGSGTTSASPTTAAAPATTTGSSSATSTTDSSGSGGSSSGSSSSGGSGSSGSSGSSRTTTGGGSASTAPSSGGATGIGPCPAADLVVSLGEETGAAGTAGVPVVFRNNGRGTCTLTGYPGVDGVVSGRSPVSATRTAAGFTIRKITLQPGDSASALVTASNLPTGSSTSCPSFTSLLVTPPNTKTTSHLPGALRLCNGLQVHPVVTGTSGS